MKPEEVGGFIAVLVMIGLVSASIYGWVMNIIQVYHSNFSEITGILVLRIVGIFMAPLGAIMGYL
jgi:hypothetical protein